jgi:hypothetical protein
MYSQQRLYRTGAGPSASHRIDGLEHDQRGQAVPLKFEICESVAGAGRTSVSDVQQPFTLTAFVCASGTAEDPIDFTTTGATSLRCDGPEGQFIQNWKTPTGANKCYRATMTAIDGSRISAFFKTK